MPSATLFHFLHISFQQYLIFLLVAYLNFPQLKILSSIPTLFLSLFLTMLCGLWDLSSPTRDYPGLWHRERGVLTTGLPENCPQTVSNPCLFGILQDYVEYWELGYRDE